MELTILSYCSYLLVLNSDPGCYLFSEVCQNVWVHIPLLIFFGSPIGYIILLPAVVLWLATKILFPAEVVWWSQSEYQRVWGVVPFWWTSFNAHSVLNTRRGFHTRILYASYLFILVISYWFLEYVLYIPDWFHEQYDSFIGQTRCNICWLVAWSQAIGCTLRSHSRHRQHFLRQDWSDEDEWHTEQCGEYKICVFTMKFILN